MLTTEDALVWHRARCNNSACVEMALVGNGVALRDSTRPEGPILRFDTADWTKLMADLRAGRISPS